MVLLIFSEFTFHPVVNESILVHRGAVDLRVVDCRFGLEDASGTGGVSQVAGNAIHSLGRALDCEVFGGHWVARSELGEFHPILLMS